MRLDELRPGLWRWTARHPDAEDDPEPESPADWPPEVGCVAYAAPDAFVFIDPLVTEDRAWEALDELVERHGRPVAVLRTIAFHRRSCAAFVERYDGTTSWPDAAEAMPVEEAGETLVWFPEHRALVPGDRLVGDGNGGLRMCPESWLRYLPSGITLRELRESLLPLLELPVELVLVSHGEPVLSGARAALARAVEASSSG